MDNLKYITKQISDYGKKIADTEIENYMLESDINDLKLYINQYNSEETYSKIDEIKDKINHNLEKLDYFFEEYKKFKYAYDMGEYEDEC